MTNQAGQMIAAACVGAFFKAGMADAASFAADVGATPVACRVMVDRDILLGGFDAQVAQRTTTIAALVAEVGVPRERRSRFVVTGDATYKVDAVLEQDDSIVLCAVTRECES